MGYFAVLKFLKFHREQRTTREKLSPVQKPSLQQIELQIVGGQCLERLACPHTRSHPLHSPTRKCHPGLNFH
jgi:hypothetical protein